MRGSDAKTERPRAGCAGPRARDRRVLNRAPRHNLGALDLLDLVELQLDRRLAPEDRDERAHFLFLRLDVVDDPGEVEEGSRGDLDAVALREVDLELGRLDPHLLEDRLDF